MTGKVPRSFKEIEPSALEALHQGKKATQNLIEWLAVNPALLLENLLAQRGEEGWKIEVPPSLKKNEQHQYIAYQLFTRIKEHKHTDWLEFLSGHPSDIARGWASYIVGFLYADPAELLEHIRPFAGDEHFAVREIAWMASRKTLSGHLKRSIGLLEGWVKEEDARLRRFAVEVLRPRGVWCPHIPELKREPEQALPLLEPLKCETNRYVQNSVANWLNDASKSRPDFVWALYERWKQACCPHTEYILKRAIRTLKKVKNS